MTMISKEKLILLTTTVAAASAATAKPNPSPFDFERELRKRRSGKSGKTGKSGKASKCRRGKASKSRSDQPDDDNDVELIQFPTFPASLGPCCNSCWCDSGEPSDDQNTCPLYDYPTCPAYPLQAIYLEVDVASSTLPAGPFKLKPKEEYEFYSSIEVENPDYEYLQLCQPDLSQSENLLQTKMVESDYYSNVLVPVLTTVLGEKSCKDKRDSYDGQNQVCAMKFFKDDDVICNYDGDFSDDCSQSNDWATDAKIKTFHDDEEREDAGYFVIHEGSCGVCSTPQDLAAYMKYSFPRRLPPVNDPSDPDFESSQTLSSIPIQCYLQVLSLGPGVPIPQPVRDDPNAVIGIIQGVKDCLKQRIDLSDNCATAWATNTYLTGLPEIDGGCELTCLKDLGFLGSPPSPPYDGDTCELNDCIQCDDSVSGEAFIELAGMSRRNAGIHTALPRSCGSLADISHQCVSTAD